MNKLIALVVVAVIGIAAYYLMTNKTPASPFDSSPAFTPINQNTNPTQQEQVSQPPTPTTAPSPTTVQLIKAKTAVMKTSKGDVEFSLYPDDAPNTINNFARKSQSGFYNGLTFHRVEDWVLQGGDPKGDGTGGQNNLPTELNNRPFVAGSLGVARGQDIRISNDAQFFIVKKDSPFLNGQYTNFGIVTKGMDVVNQMQVGDKILSITAE